jgi:hypothetical protein
VIRDYVPGELLIKTSKKIDEAESRRLQAVGIRAMRAFDAPRQMHLGDIYHVRLAPGVAVEDAMRALARERGVVWAEPNYRVHAMDTAEEALDPRLWSIPRVSAPEAWKTTTGEGGPRVAIIDTGIDPAHPNLAANVHVNAGEIPGDGVDNDGNGYVDDVHGYDFANHDGDPTDGAGHGTHVAGTIAAIGADGVRGVAPKATLMPLKFLDDGGFGDIADAVDALIYAEKAGARITSNSWGGSNFSQALYETMKASHALHICAAGNDGADNDVDPPFPAGFGLPNIVAVAATTPDDDKASFSNFGKRTVDLAAPGAEIWSTLPGGGYGTKSGTSMAAPHVTGAAALVLAKFPEMDNAHLKERLVDSVDRVAALADVSRSGGRLNVARALSDDTVGPAAITDLRVDAASPQQVRLAWTSSGDDERSGTAARYELRWLDRPIRSAADWEAAHPAEAPLPLAAGQAESATVSLLPAGQDHPCWFALDVRDKVGNAPPLATVEATVPGTKVAFRDDFEHGLGQWTADGGWAIADGAATDSPAGDYPSNADTSLTSIPIDLGGFARPVLRYKARYAVENNFDKLTLEASTDGKSWSVLEPLVGKTGWKDHACDLAGYAGQKIQLRFHLVSDGDIEMDGIHVDDLVVTEAS